MMHKYFNAKNQEVFVEKIKSYFYIYCCSDLKTKLRVIFPFYKFLGKCTFRNCVVYIALCIQICDYFFYETRTDLLWPMGVANFDDHLSSLIQFENLVYINNDNAMHGVLKKKKHKPTIHT